MKTLKNVYLLIFLLLVASGCTETEFGSLAAVVDDISPFGQHASVIDQEAEEKIVDLLVVVDNSTSMAPDQEKLSREFASFVSSISDADYRIGLITTDIDTRDKENDEGRYGNLALVQSTGKRFIEKSDANPAQLFADLIMRDESKDCLDSRGYTKPDCVSLEEKPLYAIKMAIDKRNGVNSGFFREGADLGVVIITDEDESEMSGGRIYTAGELLDHFSNEFGEEKAITAFDISIPSDDPVCEASQKAETNSGAARPALRVKELTNLTGGFSVNICDPNFGEGLGEISSYVEKNLLPLRVKVPEKIIEDSIIIRVTAPDGSNVEVDHKIVNGVLEIFPLPPEGSRIELAYKYEL